FHEVAIAQLAGDGPEDPGSPRVVAGRVDQHGRVFVEGDVGAVRAAELLPGADDDRLNDLALADAALRAGLFDGRRDHVADPGIAAVGAALDPDAEDLARARVVGDFEPGLLLDHRAFSTTSTRRQRLVFESGRVSITRTTSPSPASLPSSCACRVRDRRTTFS